MFSLDIFFDGSQYLVGKIAVFKEIGTVFEVNNSGFGGDGGSFGFSSKLDEGTMGFSEVKIDDIGGGSALNTRNFEGAGHETGEAESRIAGGIFLIVSVFVGLIDDN